MTYGYNEYIVHFNITGFPQALEEYVKAEFIRLYHEFASISEDFYAIKNAEYDKLVKVDPTLNYDLWMSGEMRKVMPNYQGYIINLDVLDDCDLVGRSRVGDGLITMYLTEAN